MDALIHILLLTLVKSEESKSLMLHLEKMPSVKENCIREREFLHRLGGIKIDMLSCGITAEAAGGKATEKKI